VLIFKCDGGLDGRLEGRQENKERGKAMILRVE
jgi:hypothetical protein